MQEELDNMTKILKQYLEDNNMEVVFLCIGSNKIIGDSIGPRVGSLLKAQSKFHNTKIIGDMEKSINAKNIFEIENELKDKFIIVIDSAIGPKELIGDIYILNAKVKLGKGLNKNILELGNISIKACVCEDFYSPIKNYYELSKVDIDLVTKLTSKIVDLICMVNE